jgi:hypothetical protein
MKEVVKKQVKGLSLVIWFVLSGLTLALARA